MKNLRILDCTLRDGGYYNSWDFDYELVSEYLDCLGNSGIDIVEIGFRSSNSAGFSGPYKYSLDNFLEGLNFGDMTVAVMINAAEYTTRDGEADCSLLGDVFQNADSSPVDLVRIAVDLEEYSIAKDLCDLLRGLGYTTCINLMKAGGKSKQLIHKAVASIAKWGTIDTLYFADSLGNMAPKEVNQLAAWILELWDRPLGFHSHNNKGLALVNCLAALDAGVTWIDSTILGMGRGAGNVATESLLTELTLIDSEDRFSAESLYPILVKFQSLLEEYKWGPSVWYQFAANNNIHPTYVQQILSDGRYNTQQIAQIMKGLSRSNSSSFSQAILRSVLYGGVDVKQSSESALRRIFEGRNVLLLGNGRTRQKYGKQIAFFAEHYNCVVVALNFSSDLNLVPDVVAISHELRLLFEQAEIVSSKKVLLMPANTASNVEALDGISDDRLLKYGLTLSQDKLRFSAAGCELPAPLSLMFALCAVSAGNAKEIFLAGCDGTEGRAEDKHYINRSLEEYFRAEGRRPVTAITPTDYQVPQGCLFSTTPIDRTYLVVIPARYASTRFPGKPLVKVWQDKTLLELVWDQCVSAVGSENVVIATDDERIRQYCDLNKLNVVMTSNECLTGTDRVAEVAKQIRRKYYINVQGDEPLVQPSDILKVLDTCFSSPGAVVNAKCRVNSSALFDQTVPKVVCDSGGRLLYISRSGIPGRKEVAERDGSVSDELERQVCIYGFEMQHLTHYGVGKTKSKLESSEDIEILRLLESGQEVVMVDAHETEIAVDTPDDLEKLKRIFAETGRTTQKC